MTILAFIGLGNMGAPMAANLVAAGHEVRGFDLAPGLVEAAAARGVVPAANAQLAVQGAEAVITMLPAGRQVRAVWGELVPALRRGTLLVDCSTIDVETSRAVHALAAAGELAALDAPVSGGTGGAEAGTLTFMCGGEGEAFARADPLLKAMGRRVVHCGGAGAGQAAKLCNNMILGVTMIATCEAFVLAERLGLGHEALYEVASASSGQSWSLTSYCPVPGPVPASPANRGYAPGFSGELMLKDLTLAREAALASGAATPLGSAAAKLYAEFVAAQGGVDFSGIIAMLRDRGTGGGTAPAGEDGA